MSQPTETLPTPESNEPPSELSAGKRRLFTAGMVLVPVLFFGLLEAGLRIGGYGADYPLFVEATGAPDYLMPSREVARRYFAHQASVPTPNPDYFLRDKPEGTFRIAAQGGSSAAGYPFYRGASFPQILGTRLRLAYPDRDVEVVNTAMAAVNSYTLLDLADEIIAQDPDVVVVYAGHNEFYGALGAASTESLGRTPGLVRTYLRLRGFRTVQLIRSIAGGLLSPSAEERRAGAPPSSTLMARMIGEQQVPLGGEIYQAGLRQFASNLDHLLATYQKAGIPVYISTLASNERHQRPFTTVLSAGIDTTAWQTAAQAGIDQIEAGNAAEAIPLLRQATEIDTLAADPFFALGRAYFTLGQFDLARVALGRARDLDALRFRAPEAFNAVIREAAERHGATVVDGEAALRAVSPGGVIGQRVMLEHLHPNLEGYSVLADAFFDAFVEDALLGDTPASTPPGRLVRLVTPMDSLAGHLRVAQLTASWPYRPEESQPLRLDSVRTPPSVLALTQRVMRGSNWLAGADSVAQIYEGLGRTRDALVTRRAMVQAYPFLADPWVELAALELRRVQASGRQDRLPYVAGLYQRALERDSANVPSLAMLGALALQVGDRSAAIGFLERAERVAPETEQVLYNLSGAYMLDGRHAEAVRLAERLVALAPENPTYQALLEGLRRDGAAS